MQRVPVASQQPPPQQQQQQMRFASTQRRGPGGQFAPSIDHSTQLLPPPPHSNGQMIMNQQQAYMQQQQQQQQVGRIFPPTVAVGQQQSAVNSQGVLNQRKRKRFADKVILPEIRVIVPEAEAYMDLLTFEQKLDSMLARKKLEIQETLKRPMKVKKKLRIYVSHSFIPGREPEREGDEGIVPQWELRVEGRLFEDPAAQAASNQATAATPGWPRNQQQVKRKFSSLFKSLVIELDKDIYGPDNHLVEWNRTPDTKETDGFQVKRPGACDRDVKCTILLLLDYQPMKFKLHPKLAKLLGIALETRPKIIEALWQYVKTHRLQDATDRDVINCDPYLEQVFGVKRLRFMEIPQRVQSLLQHPDPLVLNHLIRYDGPEKNTACYDIEVEMDDGVKNQMAAFLQNHTSVPDIAALDQKIYEIVEQVNELKVRRDFYSNFADQPRDFVERWLVSQSRDLKNMTEQSQDFELERHADHYFQPHTQEGVYRYIYGKVIQKRMELEATLGVKYN